MIPESETGDFYDQLMGISEMSFAGGHYETAYHALMAAMHFAYDAHDIQRLSEVERVANEQADWIDIHAPTHKLSRQSAGQRGIKSIYDVLLLQAESMRRMLEQRQAGDRR